VKQLRPLLTTAVMLYMTLANAGVLYAMHVHQHHARGTAPSSFPSAEAQPFSHHHHGDTCPVCLQFTGGANTVSPDPAASLPFAPSLIQKVILPGAFCAPSVFLPCSCARPPPAVCL